MEKMSQCKNSGIDLKTPEKIVHKDTQKFSALWDYKLN